jgi:hypothetical protein
MRIDLRSGGVSLARGAAIRIREGAGSTLQVLHGSVWITEENSPRDVVLQPGQRFRLAGSGLAVIEAFSDASIAVSGLPTAASDLPPPPPLKGSRREAISS